LSEDNDVQCAMVLPGNFSDGYCAGADYEIQILLIWNLKEELKRPERNSAFSYNSVIHQKTHISEYRLCSFTTAKCIHW